MGEVRNVVANEKEIKQQPSSLQKDKDGKKLDRYKDIRAEGFSTKVKLLLAGGLSGALGKSVVAPFARITVLFQVQGTGDKNLKVPAQYTKSVHDSIRAIYQNEGFYGFFKGNGTHMVKKVPYAAVKFASYERWKQLVTPLGNEDAGVFGRMAAGALAAATSLFFTYPLDVVQTHMTVQTTRQYNGIIDAFRTIIRRDGIAALYRGVSMSIFTVIPYTAFHMTLWENLKKYFDTQSLVGSALCGALSGSISSTVVYPFDTIRKHMQLNKQLTVRSAAALLYNTRGIYGFYRGLWPHFLTVIPGAAVGVMVYDFSKMALQVKGQQQKH